MITTEEYFRQIILSLFPEAKEKETDEIITFSNIVSDEESSFFGLEIYCYGDDWGIRCVDGEATIIDISDLVYPRIGGGHSLEHFFFILGIPTTKSEIWA